MDEKDLTIAGLEEAIGKQAREFARKEVELRVQLTVLNGRMEHLTQQVNDLNNQLAASQPVQERDGSENLQHMFEVLEGEVVE